MANLEAMDGQDPIEGLRYRRVSPERIGPNGWRGIQGLVRLSFGLALAGERTGKEVDYFVQVDDPDGFMASRLDPMVAAQRGRLRGEYRNPSVTLALHEADVVGYAYTAECVSGNALARSVKWKMPRGVHLPGVGNKIYVATREIVVHPGFQRKGIGTMLETVAHQGFHPEQIATHYVYDEMPEAIAFAESMGFSKDKDPDAGHDAVAETVFPFGPKSESRPAFMYRMTAPVAALMEG